jgi:hypothetical protein
LGASREYNLTDKMSFYITLPSNASQSDYVDNTKTRFKTKLKNPIYLEGSYEVALVELLYPVSWKYREDGRINIKIDDLSIDYTVQFFIYEPLPDLILLINEDFKLLQVSPIDYLGITQKIYLFLPENCIFTFNDGIHETFGFADAQYVGASKGKRIVIKSTSPLKQNLSEISNFYIYSDIVEYQVVGDEQAPLLRIVPIGEVSKSLNFTSKIFDSPHYIPVARNNLDTVEIDIRNHLGFPILFTTGEVVVKLHFKRKSLY